MSIAPPKRKMPKKGTVITLIQGDVDAHTIKRAKEILERYGLKWVVK